MGRTDAPGRVTTSLRRVLRAEVSSKTSVQSSPIHLRMQGTFEVLPSLRPAARFEVLASLPSLEAGGEGGAAPVPVTDSRSDVV